jgi:hypothetical protein
MENVVMMQDVAAVVEETIAAIRDGVAAARDAGIQAEMPTAVQFQMTVVKSWQTLEIIGFEMGENEERQGGTSTVAGTSTQNETTNGTDGMVRRGSNVHDQQDRTDQNSTSTN